MARVSPPSAPPMRGAMTLPKLREFLGELLGARDGKLLLHVQVRRRDRFLKLGVRRIAVAHIGSIETVLARHPALDMLGWQPPAEPTVDPQRDTYERAWRPETTDDVIIDGVLRAIVAVFGLAEGDKVQVSLRMLQRSPDGSWSDAG